MRLTNWLISATLSLACNAACGQAAYTAKGPGSYVDAGVRGSVFQIDYGKRDLGGYVLYADINPVWWGGFEAEARFLPLHTSEDVTETTYLVGPRIVLLPRHQLRPYVKFLAGAGKIVLPFRYATGTFFAYAPGAGADYTLTDRLTIRLIDFEYQTWQGFPYGSLNPYGLSAGVSFRLNGISRYPGRR
jgi:hypothetical protein